MEADLREVGPFEQRLEGTLHDVLGVERRTDVGGEDQAAVFVEPGELYTLFELTLTVRLQGGNRPRREVDLTAATPSLSLSEFMAAALTHKRLAHVQRAALQVRIVPAEP